MGGHGRAIEGQGGPGRAMEGLGGPGRAMEGKGGPGRASNHKLDFHRTCDGRICDSGTIHNKTLKKNYYSARIDISCVLS